MFFDRNHLTSPPRRSLREITLWFTPRDRYRRTPIPTRGIRRAVGSQKTRISIAHAYSTLQEATLLPETVHRIRCPIYPPPSRGYARFSGPWNITLRLPLLVSHYHLTSYRSIFIGNQWRTRAFGLTTCLPGGPFEGGKNLGHILILLFPRLLVHGASSKSTGSSPELS